MFKGTDSNRTLDMDIMAMVERPVQRDGLREDESQALELIEDPIEFAQNVGRILEGASDLQGILCNDTPAVAERLYQDVEELMHTAIQRRDWAAARELRFEMDNIRGYTVGSAHEFGIAYGVVLEQLRAGILELVRLRFAGPTTYEKDLEGRIADLRRRYGLSPAGEASGETPAAD